jgi:hypothetical protein
MYDLTDYSEYLTAERDEALRAAIDNEYWVDVLIAEMALEAEVMEALGMFPTRTESEVSSK